MKKYRLTLKHDNGIVKIQTFATDESQAIEKVCNTENCPKNAVVKVDFLPFYVVMTDKFMSRWGMAQGKTNKFIVECETYQQAETIYQNAQRRSEMKYINIHYKKPRFASNVLESWKTFDELGEIWKKN